MPVYIHNRKPSPDFLWDPTKIFPKLTTIRHRQGRLLGKMEGLDGDLRAKAHLHILTLNILSSAELEGEHLDPSLVRASLARRLGMDTVRPAASDRHIAGAVDMALNVAQHYDQPLTEERLFSWLAAVSTGQYAMKRKGKIHFKLPGAELPQVELTQLIQWINQEKDLDPVIKAAIAHWWFITIHPFDEENGRIARALMDLLLCRADQCPQRFYSLSAQLGLEKEAYRHILGGILKGTVPITTWLDWFLDCLGRAMANTDKTLAAVWKNARFWEHH